MPTPVLTLLAASLAGAASPAEQVDLRIYACHGGEHQGAQATYIPLGDETRFGIFPGWGAAAPKVLLMACRVTDEGGLRVECRALRGDENAPEQLPAVPVAYGKRATVSIRGDGDEDLTVSYLVFRPGTGGDFGEHHCPPLPD